MTLDIKDVTWMNANAVDFCEAMYKVYLIARDAEVNGVTADAFIPEELRGRMNSALAMQVWRTMNPRLIISTFLQEYKKLYHDEMGEDTTISDEVIFHEAGLDNI